MKESAQSRPAKPPSQLKKASIIALMTAGALAMWIANPALWLWITSRLESGTQPTMGPYGLMLGGIILTCVGLGKAISVLNRYYWRLTGSTPTVRVIMPWRRSLRGGRSQQRETDGTPPTSVLDIVMVVSVVLAVATFGTWLVLTNPTPPNIGGPGPAKH